MSDAATKAKPWPTKTRLTKTGQPVQGTVIEIWVDTVNTEDGKQPVGDWETALVVGKGWGKGGNSDLVMVIVEWADGVRQQVGWNDLEWRPVHG